MSPAKPNGSQLTVEPEELEQAVAQLATISDFVRWTYTCLSKARVYFGHGTVTAWDEAAALVLQSLELPPDFDQSLWSNRIISAERQRIVDNVAKRVNQRVPLPYLTQRAYFAGLEFYTDERVLIPRSPIAQLIDTGFSPWLEIETAESVLDLCCGGGCIGIATAVAFPHLQVTISDISSDALAVSLINVDRFEVADQVTVIESDLFGAVPAHQFDLIVSNPPYVDAQDMAALPDEYRHEPESALASGDDGLDLTHQILRHAAGFLTDNGVLIVEVGNSAEALQNHYPQVPFTWLEFDYGGDGVFLLTAAELRQHQALFG